MDATKIRINTDQLRHTEDELHQDLQRIDRATERIVADMARLNAMWTGEAHAAFTAQVSEDLDFLRSICKMLREITNYEGRAVREYDKCEDQIGDLIGSIRV